MESGLPNALPRAIAAWLQESRFAEENGDWSGSRAYLQQALESPEARRAEGIACVLLRLIARTWRKEGDLEAAADACEAAIATAERHPTAAALAHALAEREAIAEEAGADPSFPRPLVRELTIRPVDAEQLSLLEGRTVLPTPGRGVEIVSSDPFRRLRVATAPGGEGVRVLEQAALLAQHAIEIVPLTAPFAIHDPALHPVPDAVLLDGKSPRLLSEIAELRTHCTTVAVIVMGGAAALASALQLTDLGVQEVGPLPPASDGIERMLRLAVGRQKRENQLRSLALVDPLTGLYNRRGFMTLVRQQEQLALRLGRRMLHVFIDLDGLKRINDGFGHQEGDRALQDTADLLRSTFRESDVMARIGGDEFAVLAVEMDSPWSRSWEQRLQEQLDEANASRERGYELTLSVGVAALDPRTPLHMEDLLSAADVEMYRVKRVRRSSREVAVAPPLPAAPVDAPPPS